MQLICDNRLSNKVLETPPYSVYWATSSGTKVRTIVTLVPAEQGRYRLKLRHLNFDLVVLAQDHELLW